MFNMFFSIDAIESFKNIFFFPVFQQKNKRGLYAFGNKLREKCTVPQQVGRMQYERPPTFNTRRISASWNDGSDRCSKTMFAVIRLKDSSLKGNSEISPRTRAFIPL